MQSAEEFGFGALEARRALRAGNREAAIRAVANSDSQINLEVHSLLRDGFDADALTRLERWINPKWSTSPASAAAYCTVMAALGRKPSTAAIGDLS